jgi:tetratricopeptide (TPR) repeat protein
MLSILLTDGYVHGFDAQPGALDRALEAARRALDAGPANHKAHQALAWAQFFRKEFHASRIAAERTIALNPLDASAAVYMGQTLAFAGDWQRGCTLIKRAIELNPHHPGWYWYALFLDAYRNAEYRGALAIALKIDMPGFPLASVALAATYGQLGELDAARKALRELLELKPRYPAEARTELGKIWDPQLVEQLIDGLRKAGLEGTNRHQ